jgi:hypothetical protein
MLEKTMTRKQIKDYIEDPVNWYTVPGNDLVQVQMLDFGNLHYAAIATKAILNITGIYLNHEDPVTGFRAMTYHRYDPDLNCFRDTVSKTAMVNEIFKESRKEG